MIQRLVELALKMPAIVAVLALACLFGGLYCYENLDIEAYPNPVAPMIELITQPNGWSAEEVERYVTVKLEVGLSGMVHLDHIRSESLFGLSDVKCYFTWDIPYKEAKQEVLNRLQFIQIPDGLQPQLSPWNAIGEIFRYRVVGKGYSLTDLKTAEDWILERQFRQVPGVIDVVGFGGLTKEYHVEVDPSELNGQHLTINQLTDALAAANRNVGGQRVTLGQQSFDVRGLGLIKSLGDIREVVVGETNGVPVRVREIAHVLIGHSPRLGLVGRDLDPDIVQGVVLMRYGGDTLKTIEGVHERVDYIRKYHLLPPGMDIEPYYDRSALVELTTHTVIENLLVGMLLVTGMLWLFLGHARAALITAVNIPLALMIAFIGMVTTGTPANLISLGAVDFGIVVDSTVIMVENIFRHLGPEGQGKIKERIVEAAEDVAPSMLFSTLIIGTAFIPLFTLTGVAGVIFSPMAHTYAFAIGGAMFLAVTLTPVLASRGLAVMAAGHEEANWLMRALNRVYVPLFAFAIRRRRLAVLIAAVPVIVIFALSSAMGREFMPKLEEGNFWIRATLPMSVSLEQAAKYVGRMRAIVLGCPNEGAGGAAQCDDAHRSHPELTTVVSQLGRPDDGTDVSGFYNIELFAPLKPNSEWRHGLTKESMTRELSKELVAAFPGVTFNFSQAISDNVEEAMSGVKGENTVKVIGPDLSTNEAIGSRIQDILATVPGIEDLGMFHSLGQPSVLITPDRAACGRYGVNVGDVEQVVQTAIGGQAVTQVYEGEKSFDLTVRWMPEFRKDPQEMRDSPDPDTRRRQRAPRAVGAPADQGWSVARLPRGRAPLHAGEVLRTRARSGLDDKGGAGEDPRTGEAALRHAPRMGGRDQPAQRDDRAPRHHHPADVAAHCVPGLLVGQELAGHGRRARRHPVRVLRGRGGSTHHPHDFLDLRGDGLHLDLRRCDSGRADRRALRAAVVEGGRRAREGRAAGRRARPATGVDDHVRGHDRPAARRPVAWHRLGNAKAAGHRRHRWRARAGDLAAPAAAGADGVAPQARRDDGVNPVSAR